MTDPADQWPLIARQSQLLDEQNQMRCIASEIIIKLYEAKNIAQLELILMHAQAAIKELRGDQ